jgi:transposase
MDVEKFFLSLLNLGEAWDITGITQDTEEDVLIHVKYKYPRSCKTGGHEYPIYDYAPERAWQHLSIFQYRSYIVCRAPRYKNELGEVKTLAVPWASSHQSYTNMFADCVIDLLQNVQIQSTVARLAKTTARIVSDIMTRSVERGMERRGEIKNLKDISFDEKSVGKGQEYASIVIDKTLGRVIEVAEGRDEKSVKAALYCATGEEKHPSVRTATMDMWKPFINTVRKTMPHARIAFDKFHLFGKLSEAIDRTRRWEVKHEPLLKRQKYNVLKSQASRSTEQQEIFEQINAANLQTARVWKIRENFRAVFDSQDELEAAERYDLWMEDAARSGNKYVINVLKTFERHLDGIFNAIVLNISNALHERINGTIQSIIAKARGFRTFERVRTNILFYCGKLCLYH